MADLRKEPTIGDAVLFPANRAAYLYKDGSPNWPRRTDQFVIVFNLFSTDDKFLETKQLYIKNFKDRLHFLCHTAEGPKFHIEQDVLNQYNRKRVVNRKVSFDPMQIRMYDTIDGLGMRFLKLLYEFEFQSARLYKKSAAMPGGDAVASNNPYSEKHNYKESTLLSDEDGGFTKSHHFGLQMHPRHEHRLIKSIDLYQPAGRLYNKTRMVFPRLSRFDMDAYDYGQSAVANLSMAFQYENLLFEEVGVRIEDAEYNLDEMFRGSTGDFFDGPVSWQDPSFVNSIKPPEENKTEGSNLIGSRQETKKDVSTSEEATSDDGFGFMENETTVTDYEWEATGKRSGNSKENYVSKSNTKSVTSKFSIPSHTSVHPENDSVVKAENVSHDTITNKIAMKKAMTTNELETAKKKAIANGPDNNTTEAKSSFISKIKTYVQAITNSKKPNDKDIWT